MGFTLLVTGPLACFRRPEFVLDNVTYDVIPPITARALFEAIHWTPAIRWMIERIAVLHPIRTKWSAPIGGPDGARRQHLVDVAYAIDARFGMTSMAESRDNSGRHAAIFRRRALGQRYQEPPFLGCHGLLATLQLVDENDLQQSFYADSGTIDLGWMAFDYDASEHRQMRYYRPAMIDGVIDLSPSNIPSTPR